MVRDRDDDQIDWENLFLAIKYGDCTPFLGAGACVPLLPVGAAISRDLAKEHGFPLEGSENLSRVTQFLAVTKGPMYPKYKLKERFDAVGLPTVIGSDNLHRVLAELDLPLYLTTNYDDLLIRALRSRGKNPHQEICPWNESLRETVRSIYEEDPDYEPTPEEPVVFHMHGHMGNLHSLVLTEDDYIDFLSNLSSDWKLIPAPIQKALTTTGLLFLGYSLEDWSFRVLLRSLRKYLRIGGGPKHVSVQLPPSTRGASDERKRQARNYLNEHFEKISVRMYWGTCEDFSQKLREGLSSSVKA